MSTIDQLNAKATAAFDQENFQEALDNATPLVDQLQKRVVQALELRASIWEKKKNLMQALEDIMLIIKYDQYNTHAYLRAANIYSAQGRQQEAIATLEKAETSSPSDDEYDLILQEMKKARKRLKRRVDFITETPYEITLNIISFLDLDTAIACMDVSKIWRKLLLECPQPWQVVSAEDRFWKTSRGFEIVMRVKQYIKELHLSKGDDLAVKYKKLIEVSDFPKLKCLKIAYSTRESPKLAYWVYSILDRTGSSLTRLDLYSITNISSFGEFLSYCLNLNHLVLTVSAIRNWSTDIPAMASLAYVKLTLEHPPVSIDALKPLFKNSPNLKHFTLYAIHGQSSRYLDFLPAMESYCPKLQSICNNEFTDHTDVVKNAIQPSTSGLQSISLSRIRSARPLLSRLQLSTHSLRSMYITPSQSNNSTWEDWKPLSSFVFHSLVSLRMGGPSTSAFCSRMPYILRACPALEMVELWCVVEDQPLSDETTDRMFAAIAEMKHLYDLNLSNFSYDNRNFRKFIESQENGEQPNKLTKLVIKGLVMDKALLYSIAQIKTLNHLGISLSGDLVKSDRAEFARLISHLPALTELALNSNMKFSNNAARHILRSKSLKKLGIL